MRITAAQYRAIKDKSRLSKDDKTRLAKGLTPTASEAIEQEKFANFLRLLSSG